MNDKATELMNRLADEKEFDQEYDQMTKAIENNIVLCPKCKTALTVKVEGVSKTIGRECVQVYIFGFLGGAMLTVGVMLWWLG